MAWTFSHPRRWLGVAAVAALAVAAAIVATRAADRMALWRIVHDICVPDQKANASPAPCESVDISAGEDNGVAILKDLVGVAQFLAIPTRRVTGIEASDLLDAPAPNYWRAAWTARSAMEARLGKPLPREDVGMAINSSLARSQDQLHIHIDCLAPDVRGALDSHSAALTADWRLLSFDLKGRRYLARRLDSADLADAAPFQLLAKSSDDAAGHMGLETLVVVGANFGSGPGFILLADRADPAAGDFAHGEDLLDHSCAIVR
jgi:CDP-diacylglycerol pyrophosphatase